MDRSVVNVRGKLICYVVSSRRPLLRCRWLLLKISPRNQNLASYFLRSDIDDSMRLTANPM